MCRIVRKSITTIMGNKLHAFLLYAMQSLTFNLFDFRAVPTAAAVVRPNLFHDTFCMPNIFHCHKTIRCRSTTVINAISCYSVLAKNATTKSIPSKRCRKKYANCSRRNSALTWTKAAKWKSTRAVNLNLSRSPTNFNRCPISTRMWWHGNVLLPYRKCSIALPPATITICRCKSMSHFCSIWWKCHWTFSV